MVDPKIGNDAWNAVGARLLETRKALHEPHQTPISDDAMPLASELIARLDEVVGEDTPLTASPWSPEHAPLEPAARHRRLTTALRHLEDVEPTPATEGLRDVLRRHLGLRAELAARAPLEV